ncbi:MAG TPA: DUF1330 domain-containing protein [Xanthobacteraceae bacterium]|nr:DUF1330 domain-containing protein [Xanthobacteraceae bacterium]
MKARATLILAMLAGFAIGALTTQSLRANTDRTAYFVTLFDAGQNQSDTDYPSLYPSSFQSFGGHYVVKNGNMTSFDGHPPGQFVVIAFDSMDKLLQWHGSKAFKDLYDVHKIDQIKAFAVDGFAD